MLPRHKFSSKTKTLSNYLHFNIASLVKKVESTFPRAQRFKEEEDSQNHGKDLSYKHCNHLLGWWRKKGSEFRIVKANRSYKHRINYNRTDPDVIFFRN